MLFSTSYTTRPCPVRSRSHRSGRRRCSSGSGASTSSSSASSSSNTTSSSSSFDSSSAGTAGRLHAPAPALAWPAETHVASFRFWHDEKRFRGAGDASLAQHALFAAGGVRMGGNFKAAPVQGRMGWQATQSWDLLWSTSDGAHKAAPFLRPGQLINALPGVECITRKRRLALTLQAAIGEAAWQLVPRTYSLPAQLPQWRQRLALEAAAAQAGAADAGPAAAANPAAADPAASEQMTGWWVLKTSQHLGEGLEVVPSGKALSRMLERNKPHLLAVQQQQQQRQQQQQQQQQRQPAAGLPRPFICVQQYITQPMLLGGRKFGLRLWAVVLGPEPFRAYLWRGGLVLLSQADYNPDLAAVQAAGPASQGHLTNAALWAHASSGASNRAAPPPVCELQQLLGLLAPQQAAALWQQLRDTAGRVLAAAAQPVAEAARELRLPDDCAFELLGLDFLLDASLKPWLLEVNASPSMAWEGSQGGLQSQHAGHAGAAAGSGATAAGGGTERLMRRTKQAMLHDLVSLLRLHDRFPRQPSSADGSGGGGCGTNALLLQAASRHYFGRGPGRPYAPLVAESAAALAAAAAAAPPLAHVRRRVHERLAGLDPDAQARLAPHTERLAALEAEAAAAAAGRFECLCMPGCAPAWAATWWAATSERCGHAQP